MIVGMERMKERKASMIPLKTLSGFVQKRCEVCGIAMKREIKALRIVARVAKAILTAHEAKSEKLLKD